MKSNSFTLIELLVVIAIIGILAGFIVISLGSASESANDAKRKADINQIAKAILIHRAGSTELALPIVNECKIGDDCPNEVMDLLGDASQLRDPQGRYYTYTCDGNNYVINSILSNGDNYYFDSSTGVYYASSSEPPSPVDGLCGSSHLTNLYNAPTVGLCTFGEASIVSGEGPWTWNCVGDTTDHCSANMIVDGMCGSAANNEHDNTPNTDLCFSGNASSVSGDGVPYTWACTGENTGDNVLCEATKTGWINTGLGFYIMKYEAKIQGNDNGNQTYNSSFVPESRTSGTPWVNISQTQAISECQSLGSGYRLMTNSEWTEIARNIELLNLNWSSDIAGTGYLPRGYSASTVNSPGIDSYSNSSPAPFTGEEYIYNTGANTVGNSPQNHAYKRILFLPNLQALWDFAGNVQEWTSSTCNQGSGEGNWYASAWLEWDNVNLSDYEKPVFGPLGNYTSINGIGNYYGCNASGNGVARGGYYYNGINSGIYSFNLNRSPSTQVVYIGFRCVKEGA